MTFVSFLTGYPQLRTLLNSNPTLYPPPGQRKEFSNHIFRLRESYKTDPSHYHSILALRNIVAHPSHFVPQPETSQEPTTPQKTTPKKTTPKETTPKKTAPKHTTPEEPSHEPEELSKEPSRLEQTPTVLVSPTPTQTQDKMTNPADDIVKKISGNSTCPCFFASPGIFVLVI